MEIIVSLNEKEARFLEKMKEEMKALGKKDATMDDAVHQCIIMAMYEEAEENS